MYPIKTSRFCLAATATGSELEDAEEIIAAIGLIDIIIIGIVASREKKEY